MKRPRNTKLSSNQLRERVDEALDFFRRNPNTRLRHTNLHWKDGRMSLLGILFVLYGGLLVGTEDDPYEETPDPGEVNDMIQRELVESGFPMQLLMALAEYDADTHDLDVLDYRIDRYLTSGLRPPMPDEVSRADKRLRRRDEMHEL